MRCESRSEVRDLDGPMRPPPRHWCQFRRGGCEHLAEVREPRPPAPAVQIVDFVGEHDVRIAIQKSQKIYIGPKTIVTPLARDLAAAHDTLVLAQRK